MEQYEKTLERYARAIVGALVRMGFTKGELEITGRRHGSQMADSARTALVYMVARKAARDKIYLTVVARVLGCSSVHVTNCYYKGWQALRENRYPYLARLLRELDSRVGGVSGMETTTRHGAGDEKG